MKEKGKASKVKFTSVDRVVFPTYCEGAPTELSEVPPAIALERLLQCCLPLAEPISAALVERLIGWTDSVRCAALVHGVLDRAVDALDEFCR